MSEISLSAGVRANLLSLQTTSSLIGTTQRRLASGLKVSSPIDDAYQALTGWNPVSDAMATDILAISAARRLVERIGQSWQ